MTDLIRSGSLTQFPDVARSVGLDPKKMMQQARLPLACLERPDRGFRLPTAARNVGCGFRRP